MSLVSVGERPIEPVTPTGPDAAGAVVGERWIVGGVAAELALRLNASALFIRILFVVCAEFQPWPDLIAYAVLAVLLPREYRAHPGWVNLVALLRVLALTAAASLGRLGIDLTGGVLSQPASVWIPAEGSLLLLWVVLLTNRRPARGIPPASDRRTVLSAVPPMGVGVAIVLVAWLAPGVRVDRALQLSLIGLGAGALLSGRHLDLRAYASATAPLGVVTLMLAAGGVTAGGGIGNLVAAPRSIPPGRSYERAVGDITLNLAHLNPGPADRLVTVTAGVGVGNVTIDVPNQAVTTIHASVGEGTLAAPGVAFPGNDRWLLQRTIVTPARDHDDRRIRPRFRVTVDVAVGLGCVVVNGQEFSSSC